MYEDEGIIEQVLQQGSDGADSLPTLIYELKSSLNQMGGGRSFAGSTDLTTSHAKGFDNSGMSMRKLQELEKVVKSLSRGMNTLLELPQQVQSLKEAISELNRS